MDGLPFGKFCIFKDLQKLLIVKVYRDRDILKSKSSIRKIFIEYGENICKQVINNISQHKLHGETFSLTFDEWTSVKNRYYMNINVHAKDNEFWNLGLCRVYGSMPADRYITLHRNKINEFGISFNNIVSITTGGALLMQKR